MSTTQNPSTPAKRVFFFSVLILVTSSLALAVLMAPITTSLSRGPLKAGDVASQDIRAPYGLTYTSKIMTEAQREKVAAEVEPVYSQANPSIARQEMEALRAALNYITVVRQDAYATPEQKKGDLNKLEAVQLEEGTIEAILSLSAPRWEAIQEEAVVVLEQVMRSTIREDRLADARRGVPSMISLSLPEDHAAIVAEIVSAFVVPNSLYDEALTEQARQQAREAITAVNRTYVTGETIVQSGSIISPTDVEALAQFGLLEKRYHWQELVGAAALVVVVLILISIYLQGSKKLVENARNLTVATLLFLIFLFAARLIIPGHTVLPYLLPLAGFSLTAATLFGTQTALITSLPLFIMVTYGLPHALELSLFYILSGFIGVLTLGRARRLSNFFWSAAAISLSGIAIVLAYRLPEPDTDWPAILTLIGSSVVSGVASAGLAILLQFFLAQILGTTTALQLMELSRPDHPLLQMMLRNAPGTYQHSLQVANLAEQAAENIGADAMLTRVGALYHDTGKIIDSALFIENQVPGSPNPHDDLDPYMSASIIISHVPRGLDLARKYRLPRRIQDFILEHHGSMITRYQYHKAVEAAGGDESKVDKERFRYPGPRPQSNETALIMLADVCEARVRAERPKDEVVLKKTVKNTIDTQVMAGELDDTEFTLHDLEVIVESFTATLRGIYHPRIQYPQPDKELAARAAALLSASEEEAKPVPANEKEPTQRVKDRSNPQMEPPPAISTSDSSATT